MNNINYQNYLHYKLPITIKPLEYGKLIEQIGNKYIIQLNTLNVVIIKQMDNENFVKFFRKGDLMFEFKDIKKSDNRFVRTIQDQRYTFENNKLISTEILTTVSSIIIFDVKSLYSDTNSIQLKQNITPLKNLNKMFSRSYSTNIIKLRKTSSKNVWNEFILKVNNKIFTKDLFEKLFNKFWVTIENNFTNVNHMFILLKIKYNNGEFVTIGKLQRLNLNDKDWFFNWILNMMEFKSEYYNETQIESIVFSYGFKKGSAPIKETFIENIQFQDYKNNKLPISYNPEDYGKLTIKNHFENYVQFILQNKVGNLINFKQFKKYNEVSIFNKGDIMVTYKDEIISNNKFLRIIDNKKFLFENNKQILFMKETKGQKFITKIPFSKNMTNNFLVLDIETYIKNGILIPYAISIYDGKKTYSFFILDYKNSEDMILSALKSIMIKKYNNYNVYIHNLAKFDVIFLMKYLVKLGLIEPLIHNQRIISLKMSWKIDKNSYKLHFRDSYLILLASLKKLSTNFNVKTPKTIFPLFFVNENNFDYVGEVPNINYFGNKITQEEYNKYSENFKSKFWNLREETINYCNIDCISLYQVIQKFNNLIFENFKINIHKYPTLPGLAFAIFKSNFMMETIIPKLSGKIAKDIRTSYTGGAVDMYIPTASNSTKIYGYDVNALYPSQMKFKLMPVGRPIYFNGNIRDFDPNAFGFFYCKIIAPNNLEHPIIQTHMKVNGLTRTVAPLGLWEGMIFSAEMDNAIKYGYEFEILWGYTFESKYIFEDYVSYLHNLRNQYQKSHPLNYISKILLNSLYGRFGMNDNFDSINVIPKEFYPDFENKFIDQITDKIDLDYHIIVFYRSSDGLIEDKGEHNVSVSVAAAISAYSRIHMSQFKNNPNINLYYSDTDSIYTDSGLNENLISDMKLGKLKLEHVCKKALFLGPKLYCLLTDSNEFIHKVKGLKHEIELTFEDFENLLTKDFSIEKTQVKWKRNY